MPRAHRGHEASRPVPQTGRRESIGPDGRCDGASAPPSTARRLGATRGTRRARRGRHVERLARALEVSVPDLLSGGERNRQEEVRELMEDQFVAEVMPFLSQLNGMQMSSILAQVRDLTVRPRRSA